MHRSSISTPSGRSRFATFSVRRVFVGQLCDGPDAEPVGRLSVNFQCRKLFTTLSVENYSSYEWELGCIEVRVSFVIGINLLISALIKESYVYETFFTEEWNNSLEAIRLWETQMSQVSQMSKRYLAQNAILLSQERTTSRNIWEINILSEKNAVLTLQTWLKQWWIPHPKMIISSRQSL